MLTGNDHSVLLPVTLIPVQLPSMGWSDGHYSEWVVAVTLQDRLARSRSGAPLVGIPRPTFRPMLCCPSLGIRRTQGPGVGEHKVYGHSALTPAGKHLSQA